MRASPRSSETIDALRRAGREVLLAVGSDHGQETIGGCIDLDDWLGRHGLAADVAAGTIAVAGQGTAALLYAGLPRGRAWKACSTACAPSHGSANWPWRTISRGWGIAPTGGVVAAVNMARRDEANEHGVPGRRWTVAEEGKPAAIGWGQHGGWGPDERGPS